VGSRAPTRGYLRGVVDYFERDRQRSVRRRRMVIGAAVLVPLLVVVAVAAAQSGGSKPKHARGQVESVAPASSGTTSRAKTKTYADDGSDVTEYNHLSNTEIDKLDSLTFARLGRFEPDPTCNVLDPFGVTKDQLWYINEIDPAHCDLPNKQRTQALWHRASKAAAWQLVKSTNPGVTWCDTGVEAPPAAGAAKAIAAMCKHPGVG
jgi:hypothetical protein